MIRNVQDLAYPSGAVASGLTSAFQSGPNLEGFDATVLDSRSSGSTAYGIGSLWQETFTVADSGDALYTPDLTSAGPLPLFSYGVLTSVPANPFGLPAQSQTPNQTTGGQNEIRIRQKGTCYALCTTGATYAIAAGTLLIATAAATLTPIGATTLVPGLVLAIAKGTLAVNQTSQLVLVSVGGY
jgi:hypothetical protein